MRHRNKKITIGRTSQKRTLLIRTLAHSFIMHERITTTATKAKMIRSYVERLITQAKKGKLSARKNMLGRIPADSIKKLFKVIAPRYEKRSGGYTRMIKIKNRVGDNAPITLIEFI